MMRLDDDLLDLMLAAAEGRLAEHAAPRFSDRNAMTVVIAAERYPAAPQKGGTITGINTADEAGARVFPAATAAPDDTLVASARSVASVTATGNTFHAAPRAPYAPHATHALPHRSPTHP